MVLDRPGASAGCCPWLPAQGRRNPKAVASWPVTSRAWSSPPPLDGGAIAGRGGVCYLFHVREDFLFCRRGRSALSSAPRLRGAHCLTNFSPRLGHEPTAGQSFWGCAQRGGGGESRAEPPDVGRFQSAAQRLPAIRAASGSLSLGDVGQHNTQGPPGPNRWPRWAQCAHCKIRSGSQKTSTIKPQLTHGNSYS
jgi:hypothetical protein